MAQTVARTKSASVNAAHQTVQYVYFRFKPTDMDQTNSSRFSVAPVVDVGCLFTRCIYCRTPKTRISRTRERRVRHQQRMLSLDRGAPQKIRRNAAVSGAPLDRVEFRGLCRIVQSDRNRRCRMMDCNAKSGASSGVTTGSLICERLWPCVTSDVCAICANG